jgi:hypothetical protein
MRHVAAGFRPTRALKQDGAAKCPESRDPLSGFQWAKPFPAGVEQSPARPAKPRAGHGNDGSLTKQEGFSSTYPERKSLFRHEK